MFTLRGDVVGYRDSQVGEKKTPLRTVQLLTGPDDRKELLSVKDFGLNTYEIGDEIEIPVAVRAFVFRNGTAGIDVVRQREAA